MIDEYISDLDQDNYEVKKWKDKWIATALSNEDYWERRRKEFEEKFLAAQRRPRGLF